MTRLKTQREKLRGYTKEICKQYYEDTIKKNKAKKCARNQYWNMSKENKTKMKNMENNTEKIYLKNR